MRALPRIATPGCRLVMLVSAIAALASASSHVEARDATALSWVREPGAEACISAIELGKRVERQIGPVLVSAAEAAVSVEGRIGPQPQGFGAVVTVSDEDGHMLGKRRLDGSGSDCRAMDEAIVFVVSVAVDPNAALASLPADLAPTVGEDPAETLYAELRAEPPQPAAPRTPSPSPSPTRPPPPEDPPSRDAESPPVGLAVSAGAAVAAPLLPGTTAGLHAALEWEPVPPWSLRLTGQYWFPQDVPVPILDAPARLRLLQVGLQLCPRLLELGRWRAGACGGLATARFASEAQARQRQHVRWLVGPEIGVYGSLTVLGPLRARVAVTGQALRPRHRVTYVQGDQTRTAYRVPWATVRAEVAVGLHF